MDNSRIFIVEDYSFLRELVVFSANLDNNTEIKEALSLGNGYLTRAN